ncbi:MAG: mycofactocin biosynthesis glycosyltransferase MftF [Candidatus Competibacteraceae bacterium]|nr:mycofactocin biosynthesis glycosyltransferase MftF [Candidatus Competibacteraceae bacterium]
MADPNSSALSDIASALLPISPAARLGRYRLSPGLNLVADDQGGVLLCLRPLLALRLNPSATALLSALRQPCTIAELATAVPGMTPAAITAFLDRLLHRRLLSWQPPDLTAWPKVTIIVPAHGRAEATRRCVQSLLALDYPPDRREIIVVDDASNPPLALALCDLPITLLRQERNIGQSAARNLAAAQASGAVLAFIDNDCVAEPDWLKTLLPYLADPAVAIVGGRVIAPPTQGVVAAFEAVRSPLDMGAVATEVTPTAAVSYLPTCNLLVRLDALLAQGGFDASLRVGEDVDFIWRTLRSGNRAWYIPAGRVVHEHRVRWGDWLRRRADYGSSEADLQQRYPEGRRLMHLPRVGLLLLLTVVLTPWIGLLGLVPAAVAVVLFGVEWIKKQRELRRIGVALPVARVAVALGREHAAAFYHLSANAIRYYSLPLLAIGGMQPALLPTIILLLAVAPLADYQRLQPRLPLLMFVGLYWLELVAYQLGIWRGCWQRRTLRPLLPRLIGRR